MNSMRYRAAGVLTAIVLAAAGGIGAQAGWEHAAAGGHVAAHTVLASGEGPASPASGGDPNSGEGPAVAPMGGDLDSGEGPAVAPMGGDLDSGEGPAVAPMGGEPDSGEGPAFAS